MSQFAVEILRLALGVTCGFLAIAFAISTFRLVLFGQDAYRANRRLTPVSLLKVWKGKLRDDVKDIDLRASHGIALDLRTGNLEAQRRLSTEAIDDVIGRRSD